MFKVYNKYTKYLSTLVVCILGVLTDEEECVHVHKLLEEEFQDRLLSVINKKLTRCRIKETSFEVSIFNK